MSEQFPEHVAWTGGSRPALFEDIEDTAEGRYVHRLYAADLRLWQDYWGEEIVPHDVRSIFWNRARGDAHATFRHAARQKKQ